MGPLECLKVSSSSLTLHFIIEPLVIHCACCYQAHAKDRLFGFLFTGRHAAVNDKAVLVHEQGGFCHTHDQSINALSCMQKPANPASAA